MNQKLKFWILFTSLTIVCFTLWQYFGTEKSNHAHYKTSGAMKSLNWLNAQRAFPNKSIPRSGYIEAFEYVKNNILSTYDKSDTEDTWNAIGPHNIGGRTLAIALNPQNPNTIYAGSAGGGLWRSFTAGKGVDAWDYISTGFPVLGVSAVTISPTDSNMMYIGTGEVYNYFDSQGGVTVRITRGSYGIGILKTNDGGITWTKSLDWSYNQERAVHVIRINPKNENIIWAGTTEGTFKSTDAGQTWTQMDATIMVTDLVINPVDTNIVFIACGNLGSAGHGIYRTMDSGGNWTQLSNGLPSSYGGKTLLSIYESSPNTLYASIGNGYWSGAGTWLCKTENNGDTWNIVSTQDYATYQGWFAHDVSVHPTLVNNLLTMGVDIWKSENGGSTFTRKSIWSAWYFGRPLPGDPEGPPNYSHADHHDVVRHPTNPDTIYFATDGGIFRSLDNGETFEGCNGGYQTTQFYPGFISSPQDSLLSIGGMQDNSTAIYDGSLAWIRVIGGDGSWAAINPANDDTLYGSLQGLSMYRSVNHGNTWANISPNVSGSYVGFIAPFALGGVAEPNIIYAGGSFIYKSYNSGNSWTTTNNGLVLDGNPALSIAVSQSNSDIVYVTTAPVNNSAGIFFTNDGGSSWLNITDTLPNRYPMDITIDPNDNSKVCVVFSGFGTSHAYKSSNSGIEWQDIGIGLPDLPTSSVVIDPLYPNHIYVGNDFGIFVSTDDGASWQTFIEGLPDAVMAMDLSISQTNRMLRVATHGNGVFERKLLDFVSDIPISKNSIPIDFELNQNYPNPFNPNTKIKYSIYHPTNMSVIIYNSRGQEIKKLISNHYTRPGNYEILWDGKNNNGNIVSSGTYICKMAAGDKIESIKLTLVK